MKILCVVTGEALIDGRGGGCRERVKGCAGYDGGSAAHAGNRNFFKLVDL